jgi:hypothetical protein
MSEPEAVERPIPEYSGERDMDAFWEATKLEKEPSKQKWYLLILIALIVFSVPWYHSEGHMGRIVLGFPIWIWTTLLCSLGIAILTAIGILAYWKDDAE